jgi:polyisoprenoid-binding protein YceI
MAVVDNAGTLRGRHLELMTARCRFRGVGKTLAPLLLVLLVLPAAKAAAEPLRFRVLPEASELGFHATSRFANADGRFARFGGEALVDPADLTTARVSMTVEAASIDTGIRRRDNHLRSEDFLYVDRFPTISFVSTREEGGRQRPSRARGPSDATGNDEGDHCADRGERGGGPTGSGG